MNAIRWLFLRGLGLVYLVAFASLSVQIVGLVGHDGILPVDTLLRNVHANLGSEGYWRLPTLVWLNSSDMALRLLCGLGTAGSILLILNIAPAPILLALWALYLSLSIAGQRFLGFQWDVLLLEAGWLAIFFAPWRLWPRLATEPAPSRVALWLLRWLLFRLMFSSGVVKLISHDPTWWGLTALDYHFFTQPLPTWTAWYAHNMPAWMHRLSTGLMFGIELIVPFLLFFGRRARIVGFFPQALLMLLIMFTGNYTFFNFLTLVLCLLLLDDAFLYRVLPSRLTARLEPGTGPVSDQPSVSTSAQPSDPDSDQPSVPSPEPSVAPSPEPFVPPSAQPSASPSAQSSAQPSVPASAHPPLPRWQLASILLVAAVVVPLSIVRMLETVDRDVNLPGPLDALVEHLEPFRSVNHYGLFARMTTERPEIVLEGSYDGQTWREYAFRWKPGDLTRRPGFVQPHQPRLDWQLWFAALGTYEHNGWVLRLMHQLLAGSPDVLALLGKNPFPEGPPRYLRAVLYHYTFTTPEERAKTGAWWRREPRGLYAPILSLQGVVELPAGNATVAPP